MPYTPFHHRFPEIGVTEYRQVTPIVDGTMLDELLFVELYCDEPDCDCRRVVLHVHSLRAHNEGRDSFVADLAYGWESEAFYRAWAGGELEDFMLHDLKGPAVRMLTQQTDRSDEMLGHLHRLLCDPAYVERLKRHYATFRAHVEARPQAGWPNRKERRLAKRKQGRKARRRVGAG